MDRSNRRPTTCTSPRRNSTRYTGEPSPPARVTSLRSSSVRGENDRSTASILTATGSASSTGQHCFSAEVPPGPDGTRSAPRVLACRMRRGCSGLRESNATRPRRAQGGDCRGRGRGRRAHRAIRSNVGGAWRYNDTPDGGKSTRGARTRTVVTRRCLPRAAGEASSWPGRTRESLSRPVE